MSATKKLWTGLAVLLAVSFAVLLWIGGEIHRAAPPMPERVLTTDGRLIYTRADIETWRQVWQSIGGQQLGSIWGHGGYVAPDWTADWLHREAVATLDLWAERERRVGGYASLLPAAGRLSRTAQKLSPQEQFRCGKRHDHARCGPRPSHRKGGGALRQPVRQPAGYRGSS
jgi:nitric oxide reductase large subunit